VRAESYQSHWNNAKTAITPFNVIQGHRFWYQSKPHTPYMTSYQWLILTYLLSCTVSEIQPSIGPKSLYFTTPFVFNSPGGGVPRGRSPWNFQSMSTDGQGTKCRRKIVENYNRLSRVHERYRQTTDGRKHIAKRKREFTFANKTKSSTKKQACILNWKIHIP